MSDSKPPPSDPTLFWIERATGNEIIPFKGAAFWERLRSLIEERWPRCDTDALCVDWLTKNAGKVHRRTFKRWSEGTRPRWDNVQEVRAALNRKRRGGIPELTDKDLVRGLPLHPSPSRDTAATTSLATAAAPAASGSLMRDGHGRAEPARHVTGAGEARDAMPAEGSSPDTHGDLDREAVDVLVVTALQDELEAVLCLGDGGREGWRDARDRSGFRYFVREMPSRRKHPLVIAAAWSGEKGRTAAAASATALIDELDPACLAMCGICAGRRGDVSLGDVIVADRVYSFDHGKLIAPGEGRGAQFFHDIETYNLEKVWKMDVALFARDLGWSAELVKRRPISKQAQMQWFLHALQAHEQEGGPSPLAHPERKTRCPDWTTKDLLGALRAVKLIHGDQGILRLTDEGRARVLEERLLHPDGLPDAPPFKVHVGPIATGEAVQEDPKLFDRLKPLVRKTLGVEMEAAAIGYVAERLGRRSIIAKAVSDHGDAEKDDGFREFACRASAEFLMAFLQQQMEPRAANAPTEVVREGGRFILRPGQNADLVGLLGKVEDAHQPSPGDPPAGPKLRDFARYLAEIEADIAGHLRRLPAVTAALADELGLGPARPDLARPVTRMLLHDITGKKAVMAFNVVDEALKRDAARAADRQAIKRMMLQLLPVATDWRPYVEQGRAMLRSGATYVDLPLGTMTVAEAILAGIDCRRCHFVTDGKMGLAGGALVHMPAAVDRYIDSGKKKPRLVEAIVGLLAIQLYNLSPDDPCLRDHERTRKRVDGKLKFHLEVEGDEHVPRWLLMDDELLGHLRERGEGDVDPRIDEAVAVLGDALPHLRVLRLGEDLPDEMTYALHIGAMWRKPI